MGGTPGAQHQELYRAAMAPWVRVVVGLLGVLFVLPPAITLLLLLVDADRPWPRTIAVTLLLACPVAASYVAQRPRFVVSTAGVTVRGFHRTTYLPWQDVHRIGVNQSVSISQFYGAARPWSSPATAARSAGTPTGGSQR